MNVRKIVYEDISPTAAAVATASMDGIRDFCTLALLFDYDAEFEKVMTCERGYTVLGQNYQIFEPSSQNFAAWTVARSNNDAKFSAPPVLDVSFGGNLQSSTGITIRADMVGYTWPEHILVQWYRSGTVIDSVEFFPDAPEYVCLNTVEYYDEIKITFYSWSLPGQSVKLQSILIGIIRRYYDDEIEAIDISEVSDLSFATLPINSMSCTINAKADIGFMFQERQPLKVYWNETLIGSFYIDEWSEKTKKRFSLDNIDYIGVLDSQEQFMGGVYDGELAGDVIQSIVQNPDMVEIDADIYNTPLKGWIPILSRRSALAHIAIATGAIIDTSRQTKVIVKPIPTETKALIDTVYKNPSKKSKFTISGVRVIQHRYALLDLIGERKELLNMTITEETTVKMSNPTGSYQVTNGAIIESAPNYVIVSGTGTTETVLTGVEYFDYQTQIAIDDPLILQNQQTNIKEFENYYLVGAHNGQAVAQRLYDYYKGNDIEGSFILTDEQVGDMAPIALSDGTYTGRFEKLSLALGVKRIKAAGKMRYTK